MKNNISNLLFYPFENEILDPIKTAQCLVINTAQTSIDDMFASVDYLAFDRSINNSAHVMQVIPDDKKYDYIFYVLPKNKRESVYYLSLAHQHLAKDGHIVAVAANDAGGKTLSKIITQIGFQGEAYSKNKSRIYVGQISDAGGDDLEGNFKIGVPHLIKINSEEFYSQVGIYGWDKIDLGSQILLQNLPDNLSGAGADFGCGYGYIATKICERYKTISKLFCIDIDWRSVECTKRNLLPYEDKVDIHYLWADLTQKPEGLAPLDFIVMNPPFHKGKETKIELGQKMIQTAHSRLKNGGKLFIVANRQLPYEGLLNDLFRSVDKVTEERGFKVFHAQK